MDEVRLARGALLAAVRLFGVVIGADEQGAVGARVVVLDHLQYRIHSYAFPSCPLCFIFV